VERDGILFVWRINWVLSRHQRAFWARNLFYLNRSDKLVRNEQALVVVIVVAVLLLLLLTLLLLVIFVAQCKVLMNFVVAVLAFQLA